MSQQEPTGETGQLTEEQVRAYLSELREADASDIVVQAVSLLLNGAQVKLGRPDARMLIDAADGLLDAVGQRLEDRLTQELRSVLSQLRVAQVDAEKEEGDQAPAQEREAPPGEAGRRRAAAGGRQDRPPSGGPSAGAGQERGEGGATSSRLWVPPGADRP